MVFRVKPRAVDIKWCSIVEKAFFVGYVFLVRFLRGNHLGFYNIYIYDRLDFEDKK